LAAHPHFRDHRRGRRLADGFAAGEHARVCPAPAAVLAVSGHYAAGLRAADPVGEDLVYSPFWRLMVVVFGNGGRFFVPANPVARIFKETANDSHSPRAESPHQSALCVFQATTTCVQKTRYFIIKPIDCLTSSLLLMIAHAKRHI